MKRGNETAASKNSTIRLSETTKDQLKDLDFAKKGMSYEDIIAKLLSEHKRGK